MSWRRGRSAIHGPAERRWPMIDVKHVLVPTDFGKEGDTALAYGRALARQFGATLHVLHVAETMLFGAMVPNPDEHELAAFKRVNARLTDEDRDALSARAVVCLSATPA